MSLKEPHKVGGSVYVASSLTESLACLCPWPQRTYQRVPATHSVPSELHPFGHSRKQSDERQDIDMFLSSRSLPGLARNNPLNLVNDKPVLKMLFDAYFYAESVPL
jgi:hypothetical protein